MKTVLVVAAHADDEVLGCGGTIVRHVAGGDRVFVVFLADGISSRSGADHDDLASRNAAAEHARKILGIYENYYLHLPDNRLDSLPLIEVIQPLESLIDKLQPQIIYTHHHGDLNVDHRIAHQAVLTACRPTPISSVQAIYAFEVMSSTEWANPAQGVFIPNYYVDISKQLDVKIDALSAYQMEMRGVPHSRSIEHIVHLAHHRGHSVGMHAAEAFSVVRMLR